MIDRVSVFLGGSVVTRCTNAVVCPATITKHEFTLSRRKVSKCILSLFASSSRVWIQPPSRFIRRRLCAYAVHVCQSNPWLVNERQRTLPSSVRCGLSPHTSLVQNQFTNLCMCRIIPAHIPGIPATVSKKTTRLRYISSVARRVLKPAKKSKPKRRVCAMPYATLAVHCCVGVCLGEEE